MVVITIDTGELRLYPVQFLAMMGYLVLQFSDNILALSHNHLCRTNCRGFCTCRCTVDIIISITVTERKYTHDSFTKTHEKHMAH